MIQVVLGVHDMGESIAFYTEKMGFRFGNSLPGPDGKPIFADLYWADSQILIRPLPDFKLLPQTIEIYAKLPDDTDIDALYNTMKAKGVEMYLGIQDEAWGERNFGVKDVNGYEWRIAKTIREVTLDEMIVASFASQN